MWQWQWIWIFTIIKTSVNKWYDFKHRRKSTFRCTSWEADFKGGDQKLLPGITEEKCTKKAGKDEQKEPHEKEKQNAEAIPRARQ